MMKWRGPRTWVLAAGPVAVVLVSDVPAGWAALRAPAEGGGGAAHAGGPPPGHTGGFGEPTCHACHDDSDVNRPGGRLLVLGFPDRYEAGELYPVTIRLESEGMGGAGFQGGTRVQEGFLGEGMPAGRWIVEDGRARVMFDSVSALPYVQHTRSGAAALDPEVAEWRISWRAPLISVPVVFHVSANSANGDDSPLGDLIYTAQVLVQAPTNPEAPDGAALAGRSRSP